MPTTLPDLILLDAKAATGAGNAIGIGERMRYSNGTGVNRNQWPTRFKVRVQLKDTTTGGSATVLIQGSDDDSSYTTIKTFSLVIAATDPNQVMLSGLVVKNYRYFRANLSALAGGSAPVVNAYITLGSFGQ